MLTSFAVAFETSINLKAKDRRVLTGISCISWPIARQILSNKDSRISRGIKLGGKRCNVAIARAPILGLRAELESIRIASSIGAAKTLIRSTETEVSDTLRVEHAATYV